MLWADCGKVSVIQRDHEVRIQALGKRHHRCVCAPEGEIAVLTHQISDPLPIFWLRRNDFEAGQLFEKRGFDERAQVSRDQIGDLGHHHCRDDQLHARSLEGCYRGEVVLVVGVNGGDERSGVNDRECRLSTPP